jgi:hypothetical protein
MGDKADAAGVMLVGGVVKTLARDHRTHSEPFRKSGRKKRSKKPESTPPEFCAQRISGFWNEKAKFQYTGIPLTAQYRGNPRQH